ncbi:MAG: hypothetical protein KBD53_08540, partial [Candidatus Omnitrophica bacterium]|nr:hypothetical protein [Candidatus Omnitrophota bacterium]
LEECCQILWELGRDDERQLNPFPDHAIRVLQDIAGYHNPRQSILYKEQIVNFLEKLSAKPDVHEHKYSIFEIIHQILGKEGTYTTSNAATITYHPYALNASALLPLRARAISILEKGFTGESPAVVNRAFFCLLHALSYSHGSFGRPISQEEENQWLPEQFSILEIITKILKSSHSKVLDLLVQKNMHWLKKHAHHDEIKLKVCEIFSLIIVDYDFRIYRALQGDIFDLLVEEGDFDKQREAISQELEQLALEIIETEKTPSGIFQKLDDILETLEDYRCAPQPKDLLYKIALNNTELAINLFKLVVQNPEKSIAKYSSAFLYPLSHHEKFDSVVEAGIATGNKDIILNIIYAYAWGIFSNSIVRPSSINHLRKIMDLKDITYIPTLLNAISNLGRIQPSTAKDLLLEIKIDEKHANIFCHCINDQFGIPMSEFTKKDIQQILDTLVPLNIFGSDRYHIENFLKKAGHNYPELIITFLIDRLKESHRTDVKISEYIPLPYLGFDLVLFDPAIIQDLDRFVIQVLDLVLSYEGNDNFWFPKIFETVSNGYSNKAIQAMRKWLRPLNERKILSVALVLREAPENFLFDQYEFIGDLLQCAKEISGDCLKQVESNIFNISFSGSWTRSFGEPSQKHSNLKENALKITQNFSAIHPAHGFYLDIVKSAEREIEEGRARDEELEYE